MKNSILNILNLIRNYPGILFSIFLILVIPSVLYLNTFLTSTSFQKNVDFNLHTKALLAENILSVLVADFIENPTELQNKITEITKNNPEIGALRITKAKNSGEFQVIASKAPAEIGGIIKDPSFTLAFSQGQAMASVVAKNKERFWSVIKPLYSKDGQTKIGVVALELSLKDADTLITKTIFRSYIITILAILLTLFLVFQHTRLFGYVALSKKLKELDKMKDEFIRMATHELQSPIVNIRGYIELLSEEGEGLNDKQREYLNIIKLSAKNLSDLIYDILEVSRIEQGRLDFSPQKVKPQQIINELVAERQNKTKAKGLELKVEFREKKDVSINVNPNRFRQVLVNLIENAIKYTKEGNITVRTDVDLSKNIYITEVEDSGIGISAQEQLRLFEKFYRVKNKETAGIPGTGLGLWMVKKLTEKMGGKIFLESMKGVGSKFTLIFPLSK